MGRILAIERAGKFFIDRFCVCGSAFTAAMYRETPSTTFFFSIAFCRPREDLQHISPAQALAAPGAF